MNGKPNRRSICRTVTLAVILLLFGASVACERDMTVAVTKDSKIF